MKDDKPLKQRKLSQKPTSVASQPPSWLSVAVAITLVGFLLVVTYRILTTRSQSQRDETQVEENAQPVRPNFVTVMFRDLHREINVNGKLEYGAGQVIHITAPMAGRVDRVAVHTVGERVTKGRALLSIQNVSLLDGQQKLFQALADFERAPKSHASGNAKGAEDPVWEARRKMLLLGVTPEQLIEIECSNKADGQLQVKSHAAGILLEANIRAGQHVEKGDVLCRIAEPNPMWLFCNVATRDLSWLTIGRPADVCLQSVPVEKVHAPVTFVSPVVDRETQTVRIGIPLANPDDKLKNSMNATATIRVSVLSDGKPEPTGLEGKFICATHPEVVQDKPGDCPKSGLLLVHVHKDQSRQKPAVRGKPLTVPVTVVLDRDGRKLVQRLTSNGQIEMVEIKVGPVSQGMDDRGNQADYYPVFAGLKEGDRIFVSTDESPRNAKYFANVTTQKNQY